MRLTDPFEVVESFNVRKSCPCARRNATVMVWTIVTMVGLMAFVSLAIDLGRVQLAQTELQRAVDAAARYAVTGLSDGTYVSKAQSAASDNACDGVAVSISAGDIVSGNWSNNVFAAGGTPTNAVSVTAYRNSTHSGAIPTLFASTIGVSNCSIRATAIALLNTGNNSYGVVGVNGVTMSGATWIDSYNSSSGAYSSGSRHTNGDTASNTTIALSGSALIYGDAYYKTGYTHAGTSGVVSPGVAQTLSTTLSYAAPTLPGSYTNMGTFSSPNYGSSALSAGNYYYNSLSLTNSFVLNTSGAVNIYVNGGMTLSGAAGLVASSPGNVHVYLMGSSTLSIGNSATLSAVVYAPSATLNISGSGCLFGSAVANTVTLLGSGAIHVDEATGAGSGGGSGTISTVK